MGYTALNNKKNTDSGKDIGESAKVAIGKIALSYSETGAAVAVSTNTGRFVEIDSTGIVAILNFHKCEIRPCEHGPSDLCRFKAGMVEFRARKVGFRKVGPPQIGVGQASSAQIGSGKVCMGKVTIGKIGTAQVCSTQVGETKCPIFHREYHIAV